MELFVIVSSIVSNVLYTGTKIQKKGENVDVVHGLFLDSQDDRMAVSCRLGDTENGLLCRKPLYFFCPIKRILVD